MVNAETDKQQSIKIELDSQSKQKLEWATALAQKSLSEFVLGQALLAADTISHEHENICLSRADWDVFLDALENPPRPNAKLMTAFAEDEKHTQW